jgi:glycosyltransferase AglI
VTSLSVIVPVWNDPDGLQETIGSLLRQMYARDEFEIVIVDNGSTDETLSVAESLRRAHPGLIVVEQERGVRSSYAGRNRGIRRARGEILCFIDADMTAPADYLTQVQKAFESGVDYLGCQVELYAVPCTRAAEYNRAFGFRVAEYMRKEHFAPTCCLSVRRAVLERVGGFDPRLESGGDREFGERVRAAGFRQEYVPGIVLRHPARTTWLALWRKSRRTARGLAQLHYYYPDRYASAARRFLTWRAYAPTRPRTLQRRYEEVGIELSSASAALVSLWVLPIRWARPIAYLGERIRLWRRKLSREDRPAGQDRPCAGSGAVH